MSVCKNESKFECWKQYFDIFINFYALTWQEKETFKLGSPLNTIIKHFCFWNLILNTRKFWSHLLMPKINIICDKIFIKSLKNSRKPSLFNYKGTRRQEKKGLIFSWEFFRVSLEAFHQVGKGMVAHCKIFFPLKFFNIFPTSRV